jgi:uncharacterized protein YxjI
MAVITSDERTRFQLRQRLISIGEDYDIRNERGQPVFHVDGKILRIRETFVITDPQGQEVVTVKQKLLAIRETMTLERGGETIASVHKALLRLLRDKFIIDVKSGDRLVATGSFLEHNYRIRRGRKTVATVSKRWFSFRDTYGIQIEPGEDIGLLLGVAVILDEVTHDEDEKHQSEATNQRSQ